MIVFNFLIGFCVAGAASSVFMLIRNNWVYCTNMRWLGEISKRARADINAGREWSWRYDNLPDYDRMLWQFWIWDPEHFRPLGAKL